MYYGALSTDIKKSSSNWATFPEEMLDWVDRTNKVTEEVLKTLEIKGGTQLILPNSPEGDAYTVYYTHPDEDTLLEHIKKVALTIQFLLDYMRKNNIISFEDPQQTIGEIIQDSIDNEAIPTKTSLLSSYYNTPDWLGRIYLRIGIAVSEDVPYSYTYNGQKSYRGGVIQRAEKAEEKAPYKNGYGLWTEDEDKKVEIKKVEDTLEKLDEEDVRALIKYINSKLKEGKTAKPQEVGGYIVFIQYHFGITLEMVSKTPTLLKYMEDEFKTYHNQANKMIEEFDGELVKVKRDSSSMYYITEKIGNSVSKERELFHRCCILCSNLPKGSSIGICKGDEINRVQRKNGKDYFGTVVNLAARMEFTEWSYETTSGVSVKNTHDNRVAFASTLCTDVQDLYVGKGNAKSRCANEGKAESKLGSEIVDYPFTLDRIPLKNLNAGESGHLYVVSRKVEKPSFIKIGAKVQFQFRDNTILGTIESYRTPFKVLVSTDDGSYNVNLKDLSKADDKEAKLDKFKKEFKSTTSNNVDPPSDFEDEYNSPSEDDEW